MLIRFRCLAVLGLVSATVPALGAETVLPQNYPANAAGAKEFDWQKEWGSIHMNSFADGLNDPGAPATVTGAVPCDNVLKKQGTASICNTIQPEESKYSINLPGGKLANGIKYDIKRSFLNCMSKAMPNWSYNNVWDSDINTYGPCTLHPDLHSISNQNDAQGTKFIHDYTGPETKWRASQKSLAQTVRGNVGQKSLIYQPVYDARSNDARAWLTDHYVGCQQQISNNCANDDQGHLIRDVHACVGSPAHGLITDSPGYRHPVSHVFSPEEVHDLKDSLGLSDDTAIALPVVYWTYQLKLPDGKVRTALSAIDPTLEDNKTKFPKRVEGSEVEKIDTTKVQDTSDHFLSNLKSFRFNVDQGDFNTFVVVDPKDFFDLNLYVAGGKYDSGYKEFDSNHVVQTFNTCPILGPTGGYGGICDPTGRAGCNLPIYSQGGETEFKDKQDNTFSYSAYPLAWSGYVKQWAVITQDQYLRNICGPSGCGSSALDNREDYYFISEDEGLNGNPILQITRSTDYCEVAEMSSRPRTYKKAGKPPVADMPCIQYLQYEEWYDDNDVKHWSFVDLYNPVEALFDKVQPEVDTVQLFHLKADPKDPSRRIPDYTKPIAGSGSNKFIASRSNKTGGFIRLLDAIDPAGNGKPFNDSDGNPTKPTKFTNDKGEQQDAVTIDRVSVMNTAGEETAGVYLVGKDSHGNFCDPGKGDKPGCTPDQDRGTAAKVQPGQVSAIRMRKEVTVVGEDGAPKKSTCVAVGYLPPETKEGSLPDQKLFIPTNSPAEFQAFVTAAQAESRKPANVASDNPSMAGVQFWDCAATYQSKQQTKQQLAFEGTQNQDNFTDTFKHKDDKGQDVTHTFKTWAGTLRCADVAKRPACNQVRMISAQRRCQLENGSNGKCGDCAKAADPDNSKVSGFNFSWEVVGGSVNDNPETDNGSCYFSAACFAESAEGCPPADVPGGHVFCLSPDTKIQMADGSEKPIKDVKAGDEVVSFNAKQSRSGAMSKAVVKATAITKKQSILQINDLKITPLHKMVLATGRSVPAKEIKVGDKLLKANGQVEVVKTVKTNLPKITVYNLVLDKKSDGYVAGGLRVMSYPLMKEMEVISGSAEVAAQKDTPKRGLASVHGKKKRKQR